MQCVGLDKLTGKELKKWYKWLRVQDMGCCSIWFASTDKYRYCVCMGWHDYGEGPDKEHGFTDGFKVAWKIGRQTHNNIMQCDLDVDFEMPCNSETGNVDDTLEEVECFTRPNRHGDFPYSSPRGYRDWNALAAHIRKTARRVYRDWRDNDE